MVTGVHLLDEGSRRWESDAWMARAEGYMIFVFDGARGADRGRKGKGHHRT